jgi:UBX domain-containing protein 1/4
MKSTKEVQQIKEDLEKKELIKEAAAKKQEKLNDIAAKKRIQEKIAADKEERRVKAERMKAEREGRAITGPATLAATPVISRPASVYTEARLRLQTADGNVQKTFSADTTLFEVAQALEAETGSQVQSFTLTYPKKVFSGSLDFAKTLKEAGLMPSAVLIVK